MRDRFLKMMQGRYGADQFTRFLLGAAIVLIVLSAVFGWDVCYLCSFILIIFGYYRMFSKNISRRAVENERYLKYADRFWQAVWRKKNRIREAKTYHIYKCPGCSQKIRIPRGKGRIEVTCPKCGVKFIKKS